FEFRHFGIAPQQLRVGAGEPGEQFLRRQHALVRVEPQQRGPWGRRTAVSGLGVDAGHGSRGGRGGRCHGTICDRVETTASVPPAAFTAGITWGSAARGPAGFTAHPPFPNNGATVARRLDGSTPTTASRPSADAITLTRTR